MTDLSTTNLKRLLDEATPGPWSYGCDGDTIEADGGKYVLWNSDQAVAWSANDTDVHLAALAPQLAKEVLRLRKALDELYSAVVRTAEDCAIRDDHEGKLAARVAQSVSEQLFRILLEEDHDD